MYNNCVFIYTLFCGGKEKALGIFMLQNVVGVFTAFFFDWRKYIVSKIITEWNFTFPVI